MNVANVRWADCYRKFRVWPTSDTAWRTNFDAINSALLNAVNAITPGNNLPAAKVQIDAAVSTLSGLRSRNNILDVQGAAANLNTSLQGLQSTIISLQGRPLTAADVAALKTSFGTFRDSYAVYTQAAAEANAYGLGQGELQALRKMVLLQNIGIDTFYNVLGNPGTPQLLTQWQTLRDQIATMMADLNTKAPAPDPAQPAEAPATTESTEATPSHSAGIGHDRPRLFPRLRR